jgi:NAD(P)-dependent dehydrogenase (short-subunit alcohol dehydrogenase family)
MSIKRFHGRVAIVTGSTSGIGKATAYALASEGATVVIAARRAKMGQAIVSDLVCQGCEASYCETDVSNMDSVVRLMDWVSRKYGRLDVLVNNAGIPGGSYSLTEYPDLMWDAVLTVNLKGAWQCMKFAIPIMLRSGRGAIVNVSSDVGFVGSTFGIAPYVASKHGLIGMTRAAALEYASRDIRVNAVCPGLSDTDMIAPAKQHHPEILNQYIASTIPMGRMGTPAEQAAAIVWLCSDDASFVTGHSLVVDGGILAK